MDLADFVRNLNNYGTVKTLDDVALRAVNRLFFFKILKCIEIGKVNPAFLMCDDRYRGLFLDRKMLAEFGKTPEYELPESFLDSALARGDKCYGFLDGDALAAYGWYSNRPTAIDCDGLAVHFNEQYVYMYKGFTHVNHRGKRLHAVGMTRALDAFLAAGYSGMVSYVEWNNYASLRSCYRMGYTDVGNIYAARIANHYFLHSDAGCGRYGLRLAEVVRQGDNVKREAALPDEASPQS